MNKGNLIVISGASGVGKSTVIAQVLGERQNIYFSVSCTTREPRPGEVDGVDYHFISRADFEERVKAGDFLEHAQYVGNYYGTSRRHVEEKREAGFDVLLDIEVQGAAQVKSACPEAVLIFITPPSFEELERRLRARQTDSEEKIQARLLQARKDWNEASSYDYVVVNDEAQVAGSKVSAILTAERCRVGRQAL